MTYIIIAISAFIISGLTLFSGFGLGTVLTPVFILFFPAPIAIALTAIVHFFNNIFKLFLLGKEGNKEVLIKFGITAILGAIIGSFLLSFISLKTYIFSYKIFQHRFTTDFINFIIGIIILFFIIFEAIPQTQNFSLNKKLLPIGGFISGFFGGFSGNQGAFRSIFLLKCNLGKEEFIATGVIIACLVDITRLSIYSSHFINKGIENNLPAVAVALVFALLGSYYSKKIMHKVTIDFIRITVFILLIVISLGLITGLI